MNKVMIIMGSDSDWKVMQKAVAVLKEFGVDFEVHVSSAHRTPEKTVTLVENFDGACFIAGAGAAAHLAGVVAAHTTKPVIAVPLDSGALHGLDALYATVQMPSGVPVATMAIDGAKNAGLFAVQILALNDEKLASALKSYKMKMKDEVETKDNKIQDLASEV